MQNYKTPSIYYKKNSSDFRFGEDLFRYNT